MAFSIHTNIAEIIGKFVPLNMERVRSVGGRALVNTLRAHFFRLDRERANQLGGKRTHFYGQVARSVQDPRLDGDTINVSINHIGIAQRYFGGEITPKKAKYLTIPARAEAYGKRAREFDDLQILFGRGGPVALVQREQLEITLGRKRKKGDRKVETEEIVGGGIFYWLVKSVTQKPDPTILPPENELLADARAAALAEINRQRGKT
ncbi:MAG: hypothetical protein HY360_23080 [Verrucomicrobia bacterium]|nr:hypothetical protein [Verrucomicrobiota bacterium]